MKHLIPAIITVWLVFFSLPTLLKASEPAADRFFIMGDEVLHIKNAKTGQEADVPLFLSDGSLNQEAFSKIDAVFGFPTGKEGEHISYRLISMIDYFSDLVAPGKVINLNSGYRSPQYNAKLRSAGRNVAKTSTHMDGLAADFNIEGVDGKKLWELVKARDCCGVGYYGGADIHLDSGRPRFWEAATSKVRTGSSDYNQKIYLSTDYDRYKPGDKVRLLLSSISEFSFGVERTVVLVDDRSTPIASSRIINRSASDCIMIENRKMSRSLLLDLPQTLQSGRYRVKMAFCKRPSVQMPRDTLSNEIELR